MLWKQFAGLLKHLLKPKPNRPEPKLFAIKAQRHKEFYFVILSSCLGALVAEWKKFCHKKHKMVDFSKVWRHNSQ
jgi:hypothetical protein